MHDHIFPLILNGGPQSALNDSFHMEDAIMNYSDYLQMVKAECGEKKNKKKNNSNKKKAPKLETYLTLMKGIGVQHTHNSFRPSRMFH